MKSNTEHFSSGFKLILCMVFRNRNLTYELYRTPVNKDKDPSVIFLRLLEERSLMDKRLTCENQDASKKILP